MKKEGYILLFFVAVFLGAAIASGFYKIYLDIKVKQAIIELNEKTK